jgi:hypothetical protein
MKKALVLILVMACGGGGSKKTGTTTSPVTETPPTMEAKPEKTEPPKQETKMEVPPKIVLGDAKIVVAMKSKTDAMNGEIALAADGAITAVITMTKQGKKTEKKTTGKLTAAGELYNDKDEVIAKIGDDGAVTTRLVMETKENGKTVKTETKWEDVGSFDGAVFTSKKDGKKFEIDDKGKLTSWPEKDGTITITSGTEQRRAAVFMVIAMFTASKITSDSSAATSAAPVPTKK